MADMANKAPMSVVVTTSERLSSLLIQNGRLVFVKDKCRIAFDWDGKRTFYNQITELETDYERASMPSPLDGYYFVIETAILWRYDNDWIQITSKPDDIVFIGAELPELGQAKEKTLYVFSFLFYNFSDYIKKLCLIKPSRVTTLINIPLFPNTL